MAAGTSPTRIDSSEGTASASPPHSKHQHQHDLRRRAAPKSTSEHVLAGHHHISSPVIQSLCLPRRYPLIASQHGRHHVASQYNCHLVNTEVAPDGSTKLRIFLFSPSGVTADPASLLDMEDYRRWYVETVNMISSDDSLRQKDSLASTSTTHNSDGSINGVAHGHLVGAWLRVSCFFATTIPTKVSPPILRRSLLQIAPSIASPCRFTF